MPSSYAVIEEPEGLREFESRQCFQTFPSDSDPPKSPLKSARILGVALLPQNFEQDRGTLTRFSPLVSNVPP
jgi:hypothetical protein